jgi:hypothetical protein
MRNADNKSIQVSPSYRWIENAHIFLWLIKDTCWAMEYKPGGIVMIFPTISVAFYILWKSRHIRTELFHNMAVCLWIMANSLWMIGEFFDFEARHFAVFIFLTGLAILIYYYAFLFKKDRKEIKDYNLTMEEEDTLPLTENLQPDNRTYQ